MVGILMKLRLERHKEKKARGAAVVEFAVVAPLLLTLLFGIIEYGYVFMVRQTAIHAAREACRIAVLQTTTDPYTEVTDRVEQTLGATGLAAGEYTVTLTHASQADPTETVTISIPIANVALMGEMFHSEGGTIEATCAMRKEGMGAPTP
jgi:Flp pilus assembly protein TadG